MRVLLCWLFLGGFCLGETLIPMPREIQFGQGGLRVDVQTMVIAPEELTVPAQVITAALQKMSGALHHVRTPKQLGRIQIRRALRLELSKTGGGEGAEVPGYYELQVTPEGATIKGADLAGVMNGAQTFVQLLPVTSKPLPLAMIPSQVIRDWPETERRIFHLDVSQHLFPLAELRGIIDWLSFHKLNEFHLKLNGDAGWRMESLKFPKLHELGSVRESTPPLADPTGSDSTQYAGYYPQEGLRELDKYARERGVELVPCFTFVTGASALIAAYPELGAAPAEVASSWDEREVGVKMAPTTIQFFREFFNELVTVFSSKFVRLEGEGKEFHAVLSQLLAKNQRELFSGSRMARSDFSIYGRPEDAELLASVKLRAEVGLNPLRKVYGLRSRERAEATLRTRFVPDIAKLQYLVFPRLAAFAEAVWLPYEGRDYEAFRGRVDGLISRYRVMGLQPSLPYDPPSGEVLGGAVVGTSLVGRAGHGVEMVFDGRVDTFFWSEGALEKGDYVAIEFPWPIEGDLTVATGGWGEARGLFKGVLSDGVLDLSADGEVWDAAAEFFDGLATVTMPKGTRFARIRVSGPQEGALILHEISLGEPLLTPVYTEERKVKLPLSEEEVVLTFKARFEEHPEFRDEIEVLRRTFFEEWLPLALKLGLAHDVETLRTFELKEGEPGELSAEEAQEWMRKRLITGIQNYPSTAPVWFATGISAFLMGEIPEKPDRGQGRAGGAETAAFLGWIEKEHGAHVLVSVSQDCRGGRYNEALWKFLTKKSLNDLLREYESEQ